MIVLDNISEVRTDSSSKGEESVALNMQNVINLVYKNLGLSLSDYFRRLLMLDFLIINVVDTL